MKKIILLLSLCFVVSVLSAQDIWKMNDQDQQNMKVKKALTPGKYLQQAGTCYLIGMGVTVIGSAATMASISDKNDANIYVGAATAAGGIILTIVGHTKLIKAGKALDEKRKITLHPSPNGIGLALKF